MGQVDADIAHPPHGELLIPSYMRTGYNETDFYGIGKTPTKALESGIPVYAPRAVRRIQVGQARRRLTVTVMVQAARPAYIYLIDERQAAWMKHRNGIKHIAQLQAGLRYWATQEGLEALSALFDLEEAFPSMQRWAVKRIKIHVGFSQGWVNACDALNQNIRVYFLVDGKLYRGHDMHSGMIQGCTISTVDLPLVLEIFIWHVSLQLERAQLSYRFFQFADDIAMNSAVHRDTGLNRFKAVAVVLREGRKGKFIFGLVFRLGKLQIITTNPVISEDDTRELGRDAVDQLRKIGAKGRYLGVWVTILPEDQIQALYEEQLQKMYTRIRESHPIGRFQRHFIWRTKIHRCFPGWSS
jgi:hypothetical protein